MKKQFLECGPIVTIHGIKGEVRMQPWCDDMQALTEVTTLYFDKNGANAIGVERARPHKNVMVLKFSGVDTPEAAAALRGKMLFINRDDLPLAEDEYFVQDLIDCQVIDADTGRDYGKVYDSRPTGANDVYYLRDEQGKERLVPAIPDVVLERDLEAGIIKIRPLEGLFDD